MTEPWPDYTAFRDRLLRRADLLGTFVKLPTTQAIEILGSIGYDFVIIDQEHAPLGRSEIDLMTLAARASGVAPLVRVGDAGEANVLSALDCGAMGIMFPHVSTPEKARDAVRSCRYAGGARGFAGMTRASGWGKRPGPQHMALQDAQIACIAMIEDADAIEHVPAIAATEGIDAIFIGRGDLTASFGSDPEASVKVAEMTSRIAAATREANKPLMMLVTSRADAETVRALGATAILVASDHNFLKSAATAAFKDYSPAA